MSHRNSHTTHEREHTRRGFLRTLLGAGAGSLVLGNVPVHGLLAGPLSRALADTSSDRVLVMIRLKGGNDGLNTFIPLHDFGTYRDRRPAIYVPRSEAVTLTESLAMHPRMQPLQKLWQSGGMQVVRSVGYAGQNLSHFRSSDIWATGSDPGEYVNSGVLGRYLQHTYPDYLSSPPAVPPAIQIGGVGNLLFSNADDFNYAISTSNPEQLYAIARTGSLYDLADLPDCTYGEQLGYLRAVANTTFRYAGVLAEAYDRAQNDAEYLDDGLGRQLALVARLLKGGLGTRLFVVEIDGFDTHATQVEDHAQLLHSVAENVTTFFRDLGTDGTDRRVLGLTFSEFGRRVEQNGSEGTDHGAAAPVMLFGPALESNATLGAPPNLTAVDGNGNLVAEHDFRSVYATVLSRWLCIGDSLVDDLLGGTYPRLDGLALHCQATVPTRDPAPGTDPIYLMARREGPEITVIYRLPGVTTAAIHLHDVAGRRIGSPQRAETTPGTHELTLTGNLPVGVYLVTLETDRGVRSVRLPLF